MPTQDVKPPYWLQISEAVQTLAHTLLERYPEAFCAEPAGVRPLKIGIDRDIRQALEVSPKVVTEVMRRYTRRRAYREALAVPGAMRVDLHHRHPPRDQPVAPLREPPCRRPRLPPRRCTDQAPSRDPRQPGGAHGRRNAPIASPFHGMRCLLV